MEKQTSGVYKWENGNIWFLTIRMHKHLWNRGSLHVFYRIVRRCKLANISFSDEDRLVEEDLEHPMGVYRFIIHDQSEAQVRKTINIMRRLLNGFDTDLRSAPDADFSRWLDERGKNMLLNEGGGLNDDHNKGEQQKRDDKSDGRTEEQRTS